MRISERTRIVKEVNIKRLKRIVAVLLVVSVALNGVGINKTSRVQAKRGERKQSYIICTKSKKELKQLEKEYDESSQINANEEGNLEENQSGMPV